MGIGAGDIALQRGRTASRWPRSTFQANGRTPGRRAPNVVNVPANGQVKVRVAFKDFHGRSAYHCHCHILGHEDLGMMGVIEVK